MTTVPVPSDKEITKNLTQCALPDVKVLAEPERDAPGTGDSPTGNSKEVSIPIPDSQNPQVVTSSFKITGMTCGGCVNFIETSLAKVPGITKSSVALLLNRGDVTYDSSQVTPADICVLLKSKGFEASWIEPPKPRLRKVSFNVKGMTCGGCVNFLETTLKTKLPGVVTAAVALMIERADVTYDPAKTSPAAIGKLIDASGFTSTLMAAKPSGGVKKPKAAAAAAVVGTKRTNNQANGGSSASSGAEESKTNGRSGDRVPLTRGQGSSSALLSPSSNYGGILHGDDADGDGDYQDEDDDHEDGGGTEVDECLTSGEGRDIEKGHDRSATPNGHAKKKKKNVSSSSPSAASASPSKNARGKRGATDSTANSTPRRRVKEAADDRFYEDDEALGEEVDEQGNHLSGGEGEDDYDDEAGGAFDERPKELPIEVSKRMWWRKLKITLVFAVPVLFLAMVAPAIPVLSDVLMTPIVGNFTVMALLLWSLCTPVQFGIGAHFFRVAYTGLKHGHANMSLLITLGTLSAYLYSAIASIMAMFATPSPHGGAHMAQGGEMREHFFETSSTMIAIVVFGQWIENFAKSKTSEALSKLMSLQSATATKVVLDDRGVVESEMEVAGDDLRPGELIKVLRAQRVPADSMIIQGTCYVDESMLTGESLPVCRKETDPIIGGTVITDGMVIAQVKRVGKDTTLSQIVRLVEDAQASKAPISAYADKVSSVFVPAICVLAVITFIVWLSLASSGTVPEEDRHGASSFLFAFMFGISVLVIACPCALGLATPTAVMVGTGVGAKLGILIKGGAALEMASKVTCLVMDKTGTITQGKPSVTNIWLFPSSSSASSFSTSVASPNSTTTGADASSSSSSSSSSADGNNATSTGARSDGALSITRPCSIDVSDEVSFTSSPSTAPQGGGITGVGAALSHSNAGTTTSAPTLMPPPRQASTDHLEPAGFAPQYTICDDADEQADKSATVSSTAVAATTTTTPTTAPNNSPPALTASTSGPFRESELVDVPWRDMLPAERLLVLMAGAAEAHSGHFLGDSVKLFAEKVSAYTSNSNNNSNSSSSSNNNNNNSVSAKTAGADTQSANAASFEYQLSHLRTTEYEVMTSRGVRCTVHVQLQPSASSSSSSSNSEEKASAAVAEQAYRVVIGNESWLAANDVKITSDIQFEVSRMEASAKTVIFFAVDGQLRGVISIADAVKNEAPMLVSKSAELGIPVWMLTGDNPRAARAVAEQVGIESHRVLASLTPSQKLEHIRKLQSKGEVVAFVGDGINDSPALAAADLGIAIGVGTDIAIEAADMVLVRNDLRDVLTAFDLSQATMRRIVWNFIWAVLYNTLSIPMAAGVFYPLTKVTLPPELASVAMAFSSVSVAISSLLLKRYHKPAYVTSGDAVPRKARLPFGVRARGYSKLGSLEDIELDNGDMRRKASM